MNIADELLYCDSVYARASGLFTSENSVGRNQVLSGSLALPSWLGNLSCVEEVYMPG